MPVGTRGAETAEHMAGGEAPKVEGTTKSAGAETGCCMKALSQELINSGWAGLGLAASGGSLWAHLLMHSQHMWHRGPVSGLDASDPPEPGRREKARLNDHEEH
ncbi:hypothetical protein NDU88_002422 [Pleurodeles waltl]|uniref:Uncharacterized protein n=1 Tax=Pleurodeles waltl TaxID=8319 RepID=A0AAV7KUQ7_PLEWA|nr:hypothetical protein NDU88_002422 [Pleurodeles waltl]